MNNLATTTLLLTALVAPVALYLLLRSRFQMNGLIAAAISIASGWALNVAWAFVAAKELSQGNDDFISIAAYFGWACPSVLVLLTWLVWRFVARRTP